MFVEVREKKSSQNNLKVSTRCREEGGWEENNLICLGSRNLKAREREEETAPSSGRGLYVW